MDGASGEVCDVASAPQSTVPARRKPATPHEAIAVRESRGAIRESCGAIREHHAAKRTMTVYKGA
jgi:hypothetical protein